MEEKKTLFDYIGQIFCTYGIIVVIFIIFNKVIGDLACEVSTLFSLGSAGLSGDTLLQLFGLALVLSVFEIIFYTDVIIRKISVVVRHLFFFSSTMVTMLVFALLFGWFPLNDWRAWVGFLSSYAICTGISVWITSIREKAENRKMSQALKKLTKEQEE